MTMMLMMMMIMLKMMLIIVVATLTMHDNEDDRDGYLFLHSFLFYHKICVVMSDYSTVFCDDYRGVHENYGDAEGDKMKQNSAV
jgi:hypothetical protein